MLNSTVDGTYAVRRSFVPLRGAHMLLHKHSPFCNYRGARKHLVRENGAGRNHGEGCKHTCFCFLLLCWFVERVASKDSGISCLPNKGITYVATAQYFRHLHFGTIVQQQLSHLCDASKTFYMLDTLKHSNSAKKKTETELKCKVKIHRLSS